MFQLILFCVLFVFGHGECPQNSISLNDPSVCYSVSLYRNTSELAEAECQSFGGHLVSLKSEDISNLILEYAKDIIDFQYFWIGLNKLQTTEFQWTNGEKFEYTNFGPEDEGKRGKCVAGDIRNGFWKSGVCESRLPFICEKKIDADDLVPDNQAAPGISDNRNSKSIKSLIPIKPPINHRVATTFNPIIETSTESEFKTTEAPETTSVSTESPTTEVAETTLPPKRPTFDGPACPTNYTLFGAFCYRASTKNESAVTWKKAEEICQSEGGHLVSIHSKEENEFLKEFRDIRFGICNPFDQQWLGLTFNSAGSWVWSDGTSVDYTKWVPSTIRHKNNNCSFYLAEDECWMENSKFGEWNDYDCKKTAKFICKKEANVDVDNLPKPKKHKPHLTKSTPSSESFYCPKKYHLFKGYCYKHDSNNYKTWKQARAICKKDGGDLASIHSHAENLFINGLSKTYPDICGTIWIGLSHGFDRWSDGSRVDYKRMDRLDSCAGIIISGACGSVGHWSDDYCTDINVFVCKKRAKRIKTTTPLPNKE